MVTLTKKTSHLTPRKKRKKNTAKKSNNRNKNYETSAVFYTTSQPTFPDRPCAEQATYSKIEPGPYKGSICLQTIIQKQKRRKNGTIKLGTTNWVERCKKEAWAFFFTSRQGKWRNKQVNKFGTNVGGEERCVRMLRNTSRIFIDKIDTSLVKMV